MRSLSGTLLAAQRSASAVPVLGVELHDRDVGVARLRWTRWYTGSEAAGPCVAASPADGSLLRARLDGTTMYHSRVTSPGSGSTYSTWTNLGTVASAPRLGLAAAGTRALLAYVNSLGTGVLVRESTDSGGSFGGSTTLITAAGTVTAIACTLQSDGSAVVFYAVAGVVYRIQRTGVGAWGAAASWSNSLTSVSALAALFSSDHQVLVSGVRTGGDAGCWATIYGAGAQVAAGTWAGLTEIALGASGTLVTFKATGVAFAEVGRAALVESYSGGGAYDRAQLAAGVDASGFHQFAWREPQPFEIASTHGVGIAAAGGQAYLVTPAGVWNAPTTVTVSTLTADLLEADVRQEWQAGRLRLVLRNDDGRYGVAAGPAALQPGGELRVAPGYRTTVGDEMSAGMRFWITSVRRSRVKGRAVVEVEGVDGWGVLAAWRAPRQFVWAAGAASVYNLLRLICERAGLSLGVVSGSNESTVLAPAWTVRPGETGAAVVRRLLVLVPDRIRMAGTSPVLFEPLAADAAAYAYGTTHALEAVSAEDGRVASGWSRVFGVGVFAESVDVLALRAGAATAVVVDDRLTVQARANVRATTVLRREVLEVPRGELVALVNAGLEVGDVVEVTDAAVGLAAAKYRVAALRLRFSRAGRAPAYEHTVTLTGA